MKKTATLLGWALVAMVALVAVAAAAAHFLAERKLGRTIDVQVVPVAYTSDPAAVERGRYLFESRGCAECHGNDGTGRLFIDAPNGFRVWTPNITPHPDSAVARYVEADWVRTVRHGVKPDGRPAFVMPSEDYNRLTDADLAAIVAYTRSLPPRKGETGRVEMPLLIKALYAADVVRDAAQEIDHTLPPAQPVPEGPTPEHGAYVAQMCKGCHGARLAGGPIPGSPPDWPPASDLTASATYAAYDTVDKFKAMFRTGRRPSGEAVKVMPFPSLKAMNDVDVEALYLYLKTLPQPASR